MGSINLDNTGSGGTITLSSDGTSLLLDGTAVGGGADLYAAETTGSTNPTASGTLSIAIGSSAIATGNNSIAIGNGADVFNSWTGAVAIGPNSGANGAYSVAIGEGTNTYSGTTGSLAIGQSAQAVSQYCVAIGRSRASQQSSFAAVIDNNTSSYGTSGTNSIAMGQQAKAGGADNVAIGYSTLSNGTGSISLGYNAGTNSNYAAALGNDALANATRSLALGYSSQALSYGSTAIGYDARCAINYGLAFGLNGSTFMADTGFELMQLCCDTTDATATVMTTDNSGASDSNTIKVDAFSIVAFDAMIVARQKDDGGTDCAIFKVTGAAREESGNSTVTLLNSATTVVHNPENMAIAVSANTSNGTVDFTFTGLASHDIRAVATVQVTRLKYD
jgi:hypothetical protein